MTDPGTETADTAGERAGTNGAESSFEIFGRVVTGVVGALEDGAELVGATLREELTTFRRAVERRTLGGLLLLPGAGLLTAAAVLLLHQLLGHLAASLALVGALYLAAGFVVLKTGEARRE